MKTVDRKRDAFTLSLGGLTAVASFAAMPAVPNDRIRQVRDDQPEAANDEFLEQPRKRPTPLSEKFKAAARIAHFVTSRAA